MSEREVAQNGKTMRYLIKGCLNKMARSFDRLRIDEKGMAEPFLVIEKLGTAGGSGGERKAPC